MRKILALIFLIIISSYSKDCFYEIKSDKKRIMIEKNDNRCIIPFFRRMNDIDVTYCLKDIKTECEQHKDKLSITKCPSTMDDLYEFLNFEYSNDILYLLGKKGKISLQKNGNNLIEIFEAKYRMLCNISGMSGGDFGIGLFVSNEELLNKRVEGYIW